MTLSDICHVCGMKPDSSIPSLEYHKMYFHFCSQQCRDTFNAHPSLYSVKIEKQQKHILKRRIMTLATPLDQDSNELLKTNLTEMMGIKDVSIEDNKVSISYDLLQVTRQQIENRLAEIGIKLGNDWMERLRRAWVHDSEENELDNLAAPIHYYHRPAPKH
ncbi:MAG: YHS domain-containing protein [Piscirickettsiaceae bacterium]|nr:YHS domain-containing protein [Piscirickettsiaceae bacterium]